MNNKKSIRKKIIIILILLFVLRLKLVVNYSYDFVTDNSIINNKVEISHASIGGSKYKDYILFTVINNNLYPKYLSIYIQGKQKPIGNNIDVIINNISINRNGKNYKKVTMGEQNKDISNLWDVRSNGRNKATIDKEEPGSISNLYEEGLDSYSMYLKEGDIGSLSFDINLKSNFFNVLKENSKVKINLTIVDENGKKSTHNVVYRVENVKKKVKYWLALFFYMDIIFNH